MTTAVRWRLWSAAIDVRQRGRFYPAVLQAPYGPLTSSAVPFHPVNARRVCPPAECWNADHPAPAPMCSCGWRSCDTLAQAAQYLRNRHSRRARYVFGGVVPVGVTLPGLFGDPAGTTRSEQLQIVGPLLLPPELRGQGQRFERVFGVPAIEPQETSFGEWVDHLSESPAPALSHPTKEMSTR